MKTNSQEILHELRAHWKLPLLEACRVNGVTGLQAQVPTRSTTSPLASARAGPRRPYRFRAEAKSRHEDTERLLLWETQRSQSHGIGPSFIAVPGILHRLRISVQ